VALRAIRALVEADTLGAGIVTPLRKKKAKSDAVNDVEFLIHAIEDERGLSAPLFMWDLR
jgi:hypothetical protein